MSGNLLRKTGIPYAVGGLLLIMGASALSLPRLSVEHATACKSCHVNPTGGGMRTEFGNYSVALNELTLPQTKKFFVENARGSRISESVTIGFDIRRLVFDDGYIFPMQTDLYMNIEPFENFALHLRIGEDPFGRAGIFEQFALFQIDDQKHYMKVGKFYPAFGLKNSDHKAYVRERTGHGSNVYLEGIAVGTVLYDINLTAELFNPNRHGVYGLHLYRNGYWESISYLAGASFRFSDDKANSFSGFPDSRAIFGGLAWNRFTLMGELDLTGETSDSLLIYGNLTTRLEYGLYLIGEYNFFDGDRNRESGVDEFYRISLELFPIPYVELRPSYTRYTEGILKDQDDFFVQLHFGF